MRWLRLLVSLLGTCLVPLVATAASATKVRLLLPVETVRPGDSFLAGLELAMAPGWHTYWRNGGDSGTATAVAWKLPAGLTAGPILWPAPERFEEAGLVTYVYHGTITLLVPITVAADAAPGPREITGAVTWLECEKLCLPGKGSVQATLTVGPETKASANADRLGAAETHLPRALDPGTALASWDGPPSAEERTLVLGWRPKTPLPAGVPDFFPHESDAIEVGTATERLPTESAGSGIVLRKKVKKLAGEWPAEVVGLFVALDAKGVPTTALAARLPIGASGTAAAPAVVAPPAAPATEDPPSASVAPLSFGRAIGLGFLGGLILNIMPCVLPVIALKILGFVRQSGSRPAEIRRLGFVYGIGVWFSFLVLAGVVIGVKRAVGIASWGMQFGNPVFLVAMTALVTLVALSLFGVFEINVTGRALDAAGELAGKEGAAGAFFNGMLAVALATPCTAPFLAPALGYAFAADPLTILAVFSSVAFGLASPYVVLSCQPAWLRFLPKPGAWMERFKVAMGFPMLATAIWLFSLAAARFGDAGPLWLGVFLVGLSMGAWIWGEFVQRGRTGQPVAMGASVLVILLAYFGALEHELGWRSPPAPAEPAADASTTTPAPGGARRIAWKPWSRAAVDAARAAGNPVFVDFTAEWCLTCKLNERSSIEIPAVREKLERTGTVTLKGDHTQLPPAITEELQRFRRAGVPLVLVYPRNPAKDPIVLPEVLTPGLVLDALDRAAAGPN